MSDDSLPEVQIIGTPIIKFQSEENIQKLQKGIIHARNLAWYRKHETTCGNCVVGDVYEALLHVNEGIISVPENGIELNITDVSIGTASSNDYVFCMFGITSNYTLFQFSEEQKKEIYEFGDTALIITNMGEFVQRVLTAAEKNGFNGYYGFVKYYDELVDSSDLFVSLASGIENVAFWKREKYRYQQEFRFLIHTGDVAVDYLEFSIGDIGDISRVMKTSTILNSKVLRRDVEAGKNT